MDFVYTFCCHHIMWNSLRRKNPGTPFALDFFCSVPLFTKEMEKSLLVMIQLLFKVWENSSHAHWCTEHILCMFSPRGSLLSPLAPSFQTHQEWIPVPFTANQILGLCLVLDWEHITLCTALSSILCSKKLGGGHILIFWCRKTEEKNQCKHSALTSPLQECLHLHQSPIFPLTVQCNAREFQDSSAHCFFSSSLTDSHAHSSVYQVSKSCSCYATAAGKIMQRENKSTLKYQHQKCSRWIQPASVSPRLIPVQSFQVQPTLN